MSGKNTTIFSGAAPRDVASDLASLVDFQEQGISREALLRIIQETLLPHLMRYDLPEFQSMFNAFPEEGAQLGAEIALAYNQGVTNWQVSPGGATLEELCCQALCRLFGFGPKADATFMYSGTYANQEAVYLALHRHAEKQGFNLAEQGLCGFRDAARLCILTSTDAHFSIKHAARICGLGDHCILSVQTDRNHRMDARRLKRIIQQNKDEREIFCVIATAGSTSTGAVDPIDEIGEICRSHDIWLHVDGAYGLVYSLIPEWKPLFSGLEYADSVCWDPHKQMGVPIPNSLLFVSDYKHFGRMAVHTHYFNRDEDSEPNPGLKSPPSTRPLSALPLVSSIKFLGVKGVIERLRAPLNAIRGLYAYCCQASDINVCHEPDTGILCFRYIPAEFPEERTDALQESIYHKIQNEGKRSISMTRLHGKTVLRLIAISPQVTEGALIETVHAIRDIASDLK